MRDNKIHTPYYFHVYTVLQINIVYIYASQTVCSDIQGANFC